MGEYLIISWELWAARNKWLFESKLQTPDEIDEIYKKWGVEHQLKCTSQPQQRQKQEPWKLPAIGSYSITVDGAYKYRKARMGVVIRDSVVSKSSDSYTCTSRANGYLEGYRTGTGAFLHQFDY